MSIHIGTVPTVVDIPKGGYLDVSGATGEVRYRMCRYNLTGKYYPYISLKGTKLHPHKVGRDRHRDMVLCVWSTTAFIAELITEDTKYTEVGEDMSKSKFKVGYPTSNSIQFDGRESTYGSEVLGSKSGLHSLSISTLINKLDIVAGPEVVTLSGGANVDEDSEGNYYKSISGNTWNSWIKSENTIINTSLEDGAVTWGVESTDGTIREMGGLDDNPDQNSSYTSGEYMLYQVNGTTLYAYEKGVNKELMAMALVHGDRLGVKVVQGVVSYIHLRDGVETVLSVSDTLCTGAMSFKGVLNRGAGSSGHSTIGDVQVHKLTEVKPITVTISGDADSLITVADSATLASVGLDVAEGSKYCNIICTKVGLPRFKEDPKYDVEHSYWFASDHTALDQV